MDLGSIGVWSGALRGGERSAVLDAPNYTNNLLRLGFAEADFQNGGTDRLVDAIVAHGDAETVIQRVQEHLALGADHVCIQILTESPATIPMDGFGQLARVLPR